MRVRHRKCSFALYDQCPPPRAHAARERAGAGTAALRRQHVGSIIRTGAKAQ
jgi:hypothetical protein